MLKKGALPPDIPATPRIVYANKGWVGMGDWLGTLMIATYKRQYRSFKDARAYLHTLGLTGEAEWRAFCGGRLPEKGTLPSDIPSSPNVVYADSGWAGLGDWLGTGNVSNRLRRFRSFDSARDFARSLGLTSQAEWRAFCKGLLIEKGGMPLDISQSPHRSYASKGWSGMADWLGTDRNRVSKSAKRKST